MEVFDATGDIRKIHQIKTILSTVVKVEPIKASKLIPQCKNCQAFGHTKNFCGKSPRCVKCGDKPSTIECSKAEKDPANCCNCGDSHPSSYKIWVFTHIVLKVGGATATV